MRFLRFIVDGQRLAKDPACDFTGIVAGTRGYLHASFWFSAEWAGCKKIAVFTGCGQSVPVPVYGSRCEIPAEALTGSAVQVSVVGQRDRDGLRITTNTIEIKQTVSR